MSGIIIEREPLPKNAITLDPSDPIDRILGDYKHGLSANQDHVPTESQQHQLIYGIRSSRTPEDRRKAFASLAVSNQALMAVVAYQFRTPETLYGSKDLLVFAGIALQRAALEYDRRSGEAFGNFAVTAMTKALEERIGVPTPPVLDATEHSPFVGIMQFMSSIRAKSRKSGKKGDSGETADITEPEAYNPGSFSKLKEAEQETASLVHLSDKEIMSRLYITESAVKDRLRRILRKTGGDRMSLVFGLYNEGHLNDVVAVEERFAHLFNPDEMELVPFLHLSNLGMQTAIGKSKATVSNRLTRMRGKTGARTNRELALQARIDQQKGPVATLTEQHPVTEETTEIPKRFEELSNRMRQVASLLHLPHEEIARQLSVDSKPITARLAASYTSAVVQIMGASDRTSLAVELYEQGVLEDIKAPENPLKTLLTPEEIKTLPHIHLSRAEITAALGLHPSTVSERLSAMLQKTGARTAIELTIWRHIEEKAALQASSLMSETQAISADS